MHIRLTSHVTSWPAKRREEGADNVWLLLTGTECVHPPPPKYHRPPPFSLPPSQQPGGNAGGRAEWQNGAKCMQISLILRYFWARYHDDIFHKSGSRSCIGPPSPRAPWVFLRRCCRSLAGLGSAVQHG
jgi:hypothetical protein